MTPPVQPVATNLHLVRRRAPARGRRSCGPEQSSVGAPAASPFKPDPSRIRCRRARPTDRGSGEQTRHNAPLGRVLLAHGLVKEAALLAAVSQQTGAEVIDPHRTPPDPRLIDVFGAARCLRDRVLPWRRAGEVTVIAVSSTEDFEHLRPELQLAYGPVVMALASESALQAAILSCRRLDLRRRCETRTADAESCRRWPAAAVRRGALAALALAIGLAFSRRRFWSPHLLHGSRWHWSVARR
jgi:hypothetical protein